MGRPGWHDTPIPVEESNFHRLIGDMVTWQAPTGHFSVIMACTIMYCMLKHVVEIGVWKGGTSCLLADAVRQTGGTYVGVDRDIVHARTRLSRLGLDPVCTWLEGNSDKVPYDGKPIDLLFIDGDHSKEGMKADWERWTKWVKPEGWIFVDNTLSEPGVTEYMNELVNTESFKQNYQHIAANASFGVAIIKKIA